MNSVEQAAEDLVRRARVGDQNAMAMIASVAESAKGGNPKARNAYACIEAYIKSHPVGHDSSIFGYETNALKETVALANGPMLTNDRIHGFAAKIEDDEKAKLYLFGVVNFRHPEALDAMIAAYPAAQRQIEGGRNTAMARTIQAVRLPNSSLSAFSHMVGWEHGER